MKFSALLVSALYLSNGYALGIEPHERTQQINQAVKVKPVPGEKWLAIVGDSSVTGAAAHANYSASWFALFKQALGFGSESQRTQLPAQFESYPSPEEFGISNPVEPMTRVVYSKAEFESAQKKDDVVGLNLEAKGSLRIDTPEYSFGYMVGRALGMAPEHLVLTGQNGKKISSLSGQFERIFEVDTPTLPPLVLVSYVANDFCHPDNFLRSVEEFKAKYDAEVRAQLAKVALMPSDPQGTLILFLAPLDVANILSNPKILAQKVPFHGRGEVTCGELRKGLSPDDGKLAQAMANTLIGECRGVLKPSDRPEQHLARVRELQEAQVSVLAAAIGDFNRVARPGLKAKLASSVREIDFQTGDLAGDCFHPGVNGHSRIARKLLANELKGWK